VNTIYKTNFNFPGQTSKYEGKVRDVYTIDDDILVVIASDRISAFDIVMPKPIPFKGQVLNQISLDMLKSTRGYNSKLANIISRSKCFNWKKT